MKKRIGFLLIALAGAAIASCGVSRELHNIEPINLTSATIVGSVVDSLNQQPIIGAELTLLTTNGDSAVGNQQARAFSFAPKGEFRFDDVQPGSYVLRASAKGYLTATRKVDQVRVGERFSVSFMLRRND